LWAMRPGFTKAIYCFRSDASHLIELRSRCKKPFGLLQVRWAPLLHPILCNASSMPTSLVEQQEMLYGLRIPPFTMQGRKLELSHADQIIWPSARPPCIGELGLQDRVLTEAYTGGDSTNHIWSLLCRLPAAIRAATWGGKIASLTNEGVKTQRGKRRMPAGHSKAEARRRQGRHGPLTALSHTLRAYERPRQSPPSNELERPPSHISARRAHTSDKQCATLKRSRASNPGFHLSWFLWWEAGQQWKLLRSVTPVAGSK
jgi:hypothetical protein